MPAQLERAPRAVTSTSGALPGTANEASETVVPSGAGAPQESGVEANMIDSLRAGSRTGRDLIPIWLMVSVFAVVWCLVVGLMAPRWWPEFQLYRARANVQAGDYKDAIWWFQKLVDKNPENVTYRAEMAGAYFNDGQFAEALEHFQKAQESEAALPPIETDDGKAVPKADFSDMIGRSQLKLGQFDAAEKSLTQALKVNRLNPYANFAMGEVAVQKKDYRRAMEYFKVISQHPHLGPMAKPYYDRIEKEIFAGL